MERQEVVGIFHDKRVILRSSVYLLVIAQEKGGNRDAQSQTTKEMISQIIKQKLPMESKHLLFITWEPSLACLAWEILITDSCEVNEKGACLKISFISVLKT